MQRMEGLDEPFSRTCPQFFWSLEWVQRVLADVEDYRRGSMGDVNDMEAPYLELLRVADSEKAKWKAEQEARIQEEVRKDSKK